MTRSVLSRKHLKLVVTDDPECAELVPEDSVQLTLPFDDGKAVILMHEADLRAPEAFEVFLGRYQPRWLLDVRVAPRMDFIAPGRALALRHLSMRNVTYVDVLGHVSDTSAWLPFVEALLQGSGGAEGPYAIIFDEECRLREARSCLPSMLYQMDSSDTVSVSTYGRNLIAL
ncbi:hypothetical protein [Paraburkholderia sp. XV]|uniref:hypothetical protein n=1 Tax=Paraburkholderia sp. XV TaxID=2831520 RepID=UPI001CD37FD0|nr:hypothetical protein [Paraburkholderia sp. XV]